MGYFDKQGQGTQHDEEIPEVISGEPGRPRTGRTVAHCTVPFSGQVPARQRANPPTGCPVGICWPELYQRLFER